MIIIYIIVGFLAVAAVLWQIELIVMDCFTGPIRLAVPLVLGFLASLGALLFDIFGLFDPRNAGDHFTHFWPALCFTCFACLRSYFTPIWTLGGLAWAIYTWAEYGHCSLLGAMAALYGWLALTFPHWFNVVYEIYSWIHDTFMSAVDSVS